VRLFVGVEIGAAAAAAATSLVNELRSRVEHLAPKARVTWVPPERLHLTVRFIGQADESKRGAIERVLAPVLEVAPFELTLAGVSTFPPRGAPRVIWAGVVRGLDAMLSLEREISSRLNQALVPADEKAYRPHLTLGRVRDAANLRSRALCAGLTDAVIGTVRVEASTLFESRQSSQGPEYVPLQRTSLARIAVNSRPS
jgi:RNA 2',3'-cyclic 3'-phosphodiesterase